MFDISVNIGEAILDFMYDIVMFNMDNPCYIPVIMILLYVIDIKKNMN